MLKEGWMEGDVQEQSVAEWINELSEWLKAMMEVVCEREKIAKRKMKKLYDRKACKKEFVLCLFSRVPEAVYLSSSRQGTRSSVSLIL